MAAKGCPFLAALSAPKIPGTLVLKTEPDALVGMMQNRLCWNEIVPAGVHHRDLAHPAAQDYTKRACP
jgi:hypothetical protein